MSGRFGGVTRHELQLEDQVPVAIVLTLAHGVEAVVDLVAHTVTQRAGPPLKPKQSAWVLEIGAFLARQHLLEAVEAKRAQSRSGDAAITFEPRPKPDMIWWG
ncbi:MAG: hypothetical protein HQM00_06950 [Magnetococcales bacterium]|nr:hypothetical protein [Magnetococcales bacterium]